MIKLEDIIDIDLKEDFTSFCDNYSSCDNCILHEKGIINHAYDQPCVQVYYLLKIIKER